MSDNTSASDDRCAWLVRAFTHTRYVASLHPDEFPEQLQASMRVRLGDVELTDHFPSEFFGTYDLGRVLPELKTPPPFFRVSGGLPVVTEACAEVLRRFDLGRTELRPVALLKKDRKTPVLDGQFFGLFPGEHRATLLPEKSEHLGPADETRFFLNSDFKDNSAVLSANAVPQANLWIEDRLVGEMMVGDALGQALIEAGWKDLMKLVRCRVIHAGDDE